MSVGCYPLTNKDAENTEKLKNAENAENIIDYDNNISEDNETQKEESENLWFKYLHGTKRKDKKDMEEKRAKESKFFSSAEPSKRRKYVDLLTQCYDCGLITKEQLQHWANL